MSHNTNLKNISRILAKYAVMNYWNNPARPKNKNKSKISDQIGYLANVKHNGKLD